MMKLVQEIKTDRCISTIGDLGLRLLWNLLHFGINTWYFILAITQFLESYVIASGFLKRYKSLNLGKLRYLAIVVESEEARHRNEVIELLHWLEDIGVKHVCLYDMEGVLEKSKEAIIEKLRNAALLKVGGENGTINNDNNITLELCSFSDGKEAMAKAANVLFNKYTELCDCGIEQEEPLFTELQMSKALKTVGFGGSDPDLLLVYGPARCHLGFAAWRLRYTEIVHMGSLKSKRYGSLVKAIHNFTMVRQNYGK